MTRPTALQFTQYELEEIRLALFKLMPLDAEASEVVSRITDHLYDELTPDEPAALTPVTFTRDELALVAPLLEGAVVRIRNAAGEALHGADALEGGARLPIFFGQQGIDTLRQMGKELRGRADKVEAIHGRIAACLEEQG